MPRSQNHTPTICSNDSKVATPKTRDLIDTRVIKRDFRCKDNQHPPSHWLHCVLHQNQKRRKIIWVKFWLKRQYRHSLYALQARATVCLSLLSCCHCNRAEVCNIWWNFGQRGWDRTYQACSISTISDCRASNSFGSSMK